MAIDKPQRTSADTLVEATLPATFAQNAPSYAMSEAQFTRLKQQIRSLPTEATNSIWLSFALAFGGVAATILAGVAFGDLAASGRGEWEVAGWGFVAVAATLIIVHFAQHRQTGSGSEAIITELETYILQRGPPDTDGNMAAEPQPDGG
jgi:hypothetical protein